jgi:chromosomal replication initiation ATPase DnaA
LRDWVTSHYADRLLALWQAENEQVKQLSIIVARALRQANGGRLPDPIEDPANLAPTSAARPFALLETDDEKPQLLALDHRFIFENFVVGRPNLTNSPMPPRGALPRRSSAQILPRRSTRSCSMAGTGSARRI